MSWEAQMRRKAALLLRRTNKDKEAFLRECYGKSSLRDLTDTELADAVERLGELAKSMNRQRRRLFAKVSKIKFKQGVTAEEVFDFCRKVRGFKLRPEVHSLNDFTASELRALNNHLDKIEARAFEQRRKQMSIQNPKNDR